MINRSQKFIFYLFLRHSLTFLLSFSIAFWSQTGRKKQSSRKRVEKVDKSCIWSTKDKTILLECSVMLNYQLEIVGKELVTSIGDSDEFYVNLLFDRSIYRPMCTHMGYWIQKSRDQIHNCDKKCDYNISLTRTVYCLYTHSYSFHLQTNNILCLTLS